MTPASVSRRVLSMLAVLLLGTLLLGTASPSQQPAATAPLPASAPASTLRVWGDPSMLPVLTAWERRFHTLHPEVRFANTLLGSDTAMPALYNHLADLALLGRDSNQTENDGFLHTLQYPPLQLRLMNGSLATPEASPAPVFFVPRANPLRRLTLLQARQLLGCGRPGVLPARTWGELGLTGAWRTRPIHVYTYDLRSGTGLFLLRRLQGPSQKMNWPVIRESSDRIRLEGADRKPVVVEPAAARTLAALLRDPDGIAVSTLQDRTPAVRPLPLAAQDTSPAVAASAATLIDGTYPLARRTWVFADRPPGRPLPPPVAAFLHFVYSAEGQALVARSGSFLPLSPADALAQLDLLR